MHSSETIIVPRGKQWEPPEIPPLSFEFEPGEGLLEISGFIKGKREDVVAALISRYGNYNRTLTALDLTTCVWELDGTILEVSDWSFRIFPRSRLTKQAG